MSHVRMSHISRENESCLMQMSRMTHINESCFDLKSHSSLKSALYHTSLTVQTPEFPNTSTCHTHHNSYVPYTSKLS